MDENMNEMTRHKKLMIKKSKSTTTLEQQEAAKNLNKIPHSEIEKNRRQKMNKRLNDLASCLLDGSSNKNKKIDKLSILKMAVQHMKNLKASSTSVINNAFLCQSFISFQELQSLILNRSNEFIMVIKCDSGRILYASETASTAIGYQPKDLVDKLIFEIIHPTDIKQVKDQLYVYDINNSDLTKNDFLLNKIYSSGNRRSFICRIQNNNTNLSDQYKVVQFIGYVNSELESNLKYNVNSQKNSMEDISSASNEIKHLLNNHSTNLITNSSESCGKNEFVVQNYLVAYGTVESESNNLPVEFMCKYDVDGKFIYSESSIYSAIGYLPNQLKSDSIFNIVYSEDLPKLKASFTTATLNSNVQVTTDVYRIKHANPTKPSVLIKSVLYCLKNPFSGLVEYITATNQVIPTQTNSNLSSQTVHIPVRPSPEESEKEDYNKSTNRINNQQKSSSYENFPSQLNSSFNLPNQRSSKTISESSPVNYASNHIYRYNELDFQLNSYPDININSNNNNSNNQIFSYNLFPSQARSTSSIPTTLMDETEKLAIELGFSNYDFNKRRSLPYIDRFNGFNGFNNESNSLLCNSSLSGSNGSQNAFSGVF